MDSIPAFLRLDVDGDLMSPEMLLDGVGCNPKHKVEQVSLSS